MNTIKVLIVDDSSVARDLLRGFFETTQDIKVVGEAADGLEAIQLVRSLHPDFVTMDLEMPVMGGLVAIGEIMAVYPVPILVVSSTADAQKAYIAVATGALDVISKPEWDEASRIQLIAKVRLLATVPVITHLRTRAARNVPAIRASSAPSARSGDSADSAQTSVAGTDKPQTVKTSAKLPLADARVSTHPSICVIASSTGGPQALATILGMLPLDLPCPVLVSQHIADGFAQGMVDWLNSVCKLPVLLAIDGELPRAGTVYVSPSERNLALRQSRRLTLLKRLPGEIYHPTCDVLLASAAQYYGAACLGIILTGMGDDGAQGIAKLHAAGANTIAQDENSSVIFGMNRVAIEQGAIRQVLPVELIAQAISRWSRAQC